MSNEQPKKLTPEEIILRKIGAWLLIVFITIFLLTVIFGSAYIVHAGERGVLLTFGNPSMVPKSEGLGFKIPIAQKIVKLDIKTQKYEADASAASKDLQTVSTKIAVNYHLVPERTPELYKDIGVSYQDRVIQPAVQEVVKASTAQFTAEELITKRPEVKDRIKELLKERLQERGIVVEDINIINFDFSETFNKAIEAKVTAEQLKLKAVNDLERIKVEKEQTITQAQGQAEALRLQKQEITSELVNLRQIEVQNKMADNQKLAIEKWNGMLPLVTGGSLPLIDQSFMGMSLNRTA